MTPKFRAYDSGSLSRMYQPDEVMVGDGNIWIIDEDSVAGEWIVNNDIHLMQSTGILGKNRQEIFEGDILKFNDEWNEYCHEGYVDGSVEGINFVDSVKHSITIEGVEFGSDCSALVSKNKDGTGTITLIFEGKII